MRELKLVNIAFLLTLLITAKISPTQTNPLSLQNFTPQEEIQIINVFKELNVYQKRLMIVRKKELEQYVLGIAYVQYLECYIELSPLLFTQAKDYFKPSLYHEIGHCFGLEHVENKNDVMWQEARNESDYTSLDWERFQTQLNACF